MEISTRALPLDAVRNRRRLLGNESPFGARVTYLWLNAVLFLLADTQAYEQPAPSTDAPIAEFNVEPRGAALVVPVTIGQASFPFLIDTGSVVCAFDDSIRHLLSPASDAKLAESLGPAPALYEAPAMYLGSIRIASAVGIIHPGLHDSLVSAGLRVYGVIGMNALDRQVLSIDFDEGKLRFLKRIDFSPNLGKAFRLDRTSGQVHIAGEITGVGSESFLVATGTCGFGAGSIRKPLFDQMLARGQLRLLNDRTETAFTSVGVVGVRSGQIHRLTLSGFSHERLIMSDSAYSKLGLGYLSRFVVTFDFPNSTMFLRPGREVARSDSYDLGGIGLARIDGKTLVSAVAKGGAGHAAGLEKWDELISVDDIAAPNKSIFELCRLFTTAGRRKLILLRDGNKKDVTVSLRDWRSGGN